MFLLWLYLSLTAINLSYTFPILETSATALCGTTGICFVCHLSVAEFGHRLLTFNHPCVITSFFPRSNFGSEPRFAKKCAKWQFLKRRIEPKKRTFQIPHLGSICSIRFVCHLSVAEFGHSLLIFKHPRVITSFFPPSNFCSEPRFAKNCAKWQFLKRRIEPKKRTFQIPHLGSICSIRFVCHLSVAEFGHRLLTFNHPCAITSFFPRSNFGSEPRFGKNCAKWQFWKRRIEPKKRTFQIPHLGVYMQYTVCVPS